MHEPLLRASGAESSGKYRLWHIHADSRSGGHAGVCHQCHGCHHTETPFLLLWTTRPRLATQDLLMQFHHALGHRHAPCLGLRMCQGTTLHSCAHHSHGQDRRGLMDIHRHHRHDVPEFHGSSFQGSVHCQGEYRIHLHCGSDRWNHQTTAHCATAAECQRCTLHL